MTSRLSTFTHGACLLLGTLALVGCLGRSVTRLADNPLSPTALSTVVVDPPAAIIAIGGTQQLSSTGIAFDGTAITTFDSVLYQLRTPADTLRVRLSSGGLVTGVATSGSSVLVNAIAFKDGAIKGDEAVVQVTPAAATGLTLSVQPVAPDSAKLAVGTIKTITPVLRNPSTGASVANPAVRYAIRATDSTRLDVFRGPIDLTLPNSLSAFPVRAASQLYSTLGTNQIVALSGEGSAWVFALINAYGTVLRDSVQYALSYPYTRTLSTVKVNLAVQNLYAGQSLALAPGATVTFQNGVAATDPLTIAYTFDNPTAATAATPASTAGGASGNISPLIGGQSSNRRFLTPGTYRWTAMAAGGPAPWPGQTQSGTLVIK